MSSTSCQLVFEGLTQKDLNRGLALVGGLAREDGFEFGSSVAYIEELDADEAAIYGLGTNLEVSMDFVGDGAVRDLASIMTQLASMTDGDYSVYMDNDFEIARRVSGKLKVHDWPELAELLKDARLAS